MQYDAQIAEEMMIMSFLRYKMNSIIDVAKNYNEIERECIDGHIDKIKNSIMRRRSMGYRSKALLSEYTEVLKIYDKMMVHTLCITSNDKFGIIKRQFDTDLHHYCSP